MWIRDSTREYSNYMTRFKALDTFGNYQRPYPLDVPAPYVYSNKPVKFGLSWSSKLQEKKKGMEKRCVFSYS